MREGLALPACVRSVEDHGYLLSLGIKARPASQLGGAGRGRQALAADCAARWLEDAQLAVEGAAGADIRHAAAWHHPPWPCTATAAVCSPRTPRRA